MELLLGRKTYEIFAADWPRPEGEVAEKLNAAAKRVRLDAVMMERIFG
jgi:dihydrofolate reductase